MQIIKRKISATKETTEEFGRVQQVLILTAGLYCEQQTESASRKRLIYCGI